MASTSTKNSGRVNPDTTTNVDAGKTGTSASHRSRTAIYAAKWTRSVTKAFKRITCAGVASASARIAAILAKQTSACAAASGGTVPPSVMPNWPDVTSRLCPGETRQPCAYFPNGFAIVAGIKAFIFSPYALRPMSSSHWKEYTETLPNPRARTYFVPEIAAIDRVLDDLVAFRVPSFRRQTPTKAEK